MEDKSPDLRWRPFYSLLKREIGRFMKVMAQTVITPIINSCLYLLIFGVSLGKSIDIGGGFTYLAFLIPGLIMMACLNNAFQNSSSSIIGAKFGGDLEDLKAAPLSHQQIIWAYSFGGLFRGFIVGLLTFLVGELFYLLTYDEWLMVAHPGVLFLFLTVGALSFAQLGISVAFWARSFDHLNAVGSFILLPLIYLGGVFFSIETLHPFWQGIARMNPLLYFINGVRYGILGTSDVEVATAFTVSIVALGATTLIALFSLKKGTFLRW